MALPIDQEVEKGVTLVAEILGPDGHEDICCCYILMGVVDDVWIQEFMQTLGASNVW